MPRKLRIAKQQRELHGGQIEQMICGHDFFCDAYGRGDDLDEARMRQDWIEHREEIQEAAADKSRPNWPLYAELRFDRGLSRAAALKACNTSRSIQ